MHTSGGRSSRPPTFTQRTVEREVHTTSLITSPPMESIEVRDRFLLTHAGRGVEGETHHGQGGR